jgi:predicted ATPase/DNA-binding SARP family transcriptional activator
MQEAETVAHQPAIRIRLLGSFEIDVDGRRVATAGWRLRKAEDLVKILALAPGHRLHRDQLIDVLWPDKDPAAGANNLYQAIHAARAALAGSRPALTIRDGIVHLGGPSDDDAWVDVDAFEEAVRRSDGSIAALEGARTLYQGDLLPDDPYADWAIARRDALRGQQLRILRDLALAHERGGRPEDAIEALRAALLVDPLDEEIQRQLIRHEGRTGNRAAAVRRFETLRSTLRTELDVEPTDETVEAYREALGADSSGSSGTGPGRRTNLPTLLTSFVGRRRELEDVQHALRSSRLVTLTGTGGTGKTRLAIQAARSMAEAWPDGVWLVELAPVGTGALVARAIADVLGIREPSGASLEDRIGRTLADRTALLVTDNCEHVIDAMAALVSAILAAAPTTSILATSRQPLRVAGEVVMRVPSLSVGDPSTASPAGEPPEAVALFVERAHSAKPGFKLTDENAGDVARLCYHLDGLPLAVELAASRVGSLPVGVLLDRLDQRFALLVGGSRTALSRHETLQATLDWSYTLLDAEARRVLRAISVFADGASAEAAEAVAADAGNPAGVLSVVAELVDQSLVNLDESRPEPRYRLLETVRQYARDRLAEAGETEAVERRLFAWSVASARGGAGTGDDWAAHVARVDAEHDNFRAVLERALDRDPSTALALAEALWPFWLWSGHLAEGRRWLTRALDRATGADVALRARALLGLGALIGRSGDPRRHAQVAAEAGTMLRDLGDTIGEVRALQSRGIGHWAADELDLAEDAFARSQSLASGAGHVAGAAAALVCLGIVRAYHDELAAAEQMIADGATLLRDLIDDERSVPPMLDEGETVVRDPLTGRLQLVFEQTFAPFRDMTPREAYGHVLLTQGRLARRAGDWDRGRVHSKAALDLFQAIQDERGLADAMASIAALDAEAGDLEAAIPVLRDALAIRRGLGDFRGAALAESNLGRLEAIAGRLDEAARLLSGALAAFRRHGDAWGTAATLVQIANLSDAQGNRDAARGFLEESLAASRATGRKRWVAWTLLQLAAIDDGRGTRAAQEAKDIFEAIGERRGLAEAEALFADRKGRYVPAKVGRQSSRRSPARRGARRPN